MRDAVLHRFADPQCRSLPVGASCAAGRLFCMAVDRGVREPSALTRCTRGDGSTAVAEIVAWTSMSSRPMSRAGKRGLDTRDCDRPRAVGEYTCRDITADDVSVTTRCLSRVDPQRVVDLRSFG